MKISGYAPDTGPQLTDYLLGNQSSGPSTKKFLLSDLINLFLNNIPAAEGGFGFISSGGVWSGDAYGSTRAASMTAMRVKVGSTFLTIPAVTARIFTASRDTYVDVLDNGDGTGTLVYTEATNNSTSPALAANSLRIAIIVTGASNIAAAGSINQGQENMVLPIISSVPLTVTDSLGNLICPRDPTRKTLGYRQSSTNQTGVGASDVVHAGLAATVFVPGSGRKVKIEAHIPFISSTVVCNASIAIYNNATATGSPIQQSEMIIPTNTQHIALSTFIEHTPAAGTQSYCVAINVSSGTGSTSLSSTRLAILRIELA